MIREACGAAIVAATLALTGCAGPATTPRPTAGALPEGVALELYQTRTDVGQRRLEVSVHNGTDSALTVTRLEFDSTQFIEAVEWRRAPTTIAPGRIADLPVLLPRAACDVERVVTAVALDYVFEDGTAGSARAVPADPEGRMPQLRRDDCLAQSVSDVARLAIVDPPRTVEVNGVTVAHVDVVVTPTGDAGSFTIEHTDSTTLVAPADPVTGETLTTRDLGVTVRGTDEPSIVTLTFVPNRCDPHAVAEDKRGTYFGLLIRTGAGVEGFVYVPSPDPVRQGIYAYVARVCGAG